MFENLDFSIRCATESFHMKLKKPTGEALPVDRCQEHTPTEKLGPCEPYAASNEGFFDTIKSKIAKHLMDAAVKRIVNHIGHYHDDLIKRAGNATKISGMYRNDMKTMQGKISGKKCNLEKMKKLFPKVGALDCKTVMAGMKEESFIEGHMKAILSHEPVSTLDELKAYYRTIDRIFGSLKWFRVYDNGEGCPTLSLDRDAIKVEPHKSFFEIGYTDKWPSTVIAAAGDVERNIDNCVKLQSVFDEFMKKVITKYEAGYESRANMTELHKLLTQQMHCMYNLYADVLDGAMFYHYFDHGLAIAERIAGTFE